MKRSEARSLQAAMAARRAEIADELETLAAYGSRSITGGRLLETLGHASTWGRRLAGESAQDVVDQLRTRLRALPPGETGRLNRDLQDLRIAVLGDDQLAASYRGYADVQTVSLAESLAAAPDVDVVLVASSRPRDLQGATAGARGEPVSVRSTIASIRGTGTPVVFLARDDHRRFEENVKVAAECDAILTTASEYLARYRKRCPGMTVDLAPLGVSPRLYSPIGTRPAERSIVPFAGSWIGPKAAKRRVYADMLMEGLLASGVDPLLLKVDGWTRSREAYPERYGLHVAHVTEHEARALDRVADLALNIDAAQPGSSTCADRILALQASGTLVLSTYSIRTNSDYPWVLTVNSVEDVVRTVQDMPLADLRRRQASGIRRVVTEDHVVHQLAAIAQAAGRSVTVRAPRLLAVADSVSPALVDAMERQSVGQVPVISTDAYQQNGGEADIVLTVDGRYSYGADYAADLVAAFSYSDADVVTKRVGPLEELEASAHQHVDSIEDPAAAGWWASGSSAPLELSAEAAGRVYAIDSLGVEPAREQVRLAPRRTKSARASIVVPIYNNGDHLLDKCFASIVRCSRFDELDVILVDDGSTDARTPEVVKGLEHTYPNVRTYFFEPGGSGSASRPRNKGLELTTTEFVGYLDPDDEFIDDGFAHLLTAIESRDVDFVIGDMVQWGRRPVVLSAAELLRPALVEADGVLEVDPGALERTGFIPLSMEALVARTEWLKGAGIEQPVGAVGQDSFFYQQMLYHARRIMVLDRSVYAYYSVVTGSIVNAVSLKYFHKYLPLEQARTAWLREVGLMDAYKRTRLENYFKRWYIPKLAKVPAEDRPEATRVVGELGRMYGEMSWSDPVVREFWAELESLETSAVVN